MSLRVGINAIALLSPLTGVGRYARSLISELRTDPEIDPLLFYGSNWSRELRDAPLPGIDIGKNLIKRLAPSPYRVYRAIAQRTFSAGSRRHRIDVYHEPNILAYRFEGPTVVTVHDLSWIHYPETHPSDRVANLNRFFPLSLEADHIITDAEFVRQQLIREMNVSPDRITAIPLAAREVFHPRTAVDCETTMKALDLQFGVFLLSVGTVEPRKNLALTVNAYSSLPGEVRRRFPLVIVGMRGWLASPMESILGTLVRAGDVRLLGFVDDEQLACLYAGCRAMIYPSLYEGFGLPPLEAMASGAPVVVSNASALPEVVGNAGRIVEPDDVDALRSLLCELIDDPRKCDWLRAAGLARASEFSWQRCARATASVYRRAMHG